MSDGVRSAAGHRDINFDWHVWRANEAGAPQDFEQMLALLVQRVEDGQASLVWANPGDWGIDVLVGDLNGAVTIWQAKYFRRGIGRGQLRQIEESFESAMRAAAREGHRVARWVLCVPVSMDGQARQSFDEWRAASQRRTGVRIDLWDDNALRDRLLRPEAEDIRREYYEPDRGRPGEDEARPAAIVVVPPPARAPEPEPDAPWRGGDELRFGIDCYLLHGDPVERRSADGASLTREAPADQIEPRPGRVWLRQVRQLTAAAAGPRDLLRAQARLLASLEGAPDAPRLLDVYEDQAHGATTLVLARPAGRTWGEVHRPGCAAADRLIAARILTAAAPLCAVLGELHRRGLSHRALTPHSILVVDQGRKAVLRDLGLAGVPPAPNEGPVDGRAPEQSRPLGMGGPPSPHTDVYQLAAVLYETFTGRRPAPEPAPVRASAAVVPKALDDALLRALDRDPRRRPKDAPALARALAAGRSEIARGPRP
jgi:hypothetical protein